MVAENLPGICVNTDDGFLLSVPMCNQKSLTSSLPDSESEDQFLPFSCYKNLNKSCDEMDHKFFQLFGLKDASGSSSGRVSAELTL